MAFGQLNLIGKMTLDRAFVTMASSSAGCVMHFVYILRCSDGSLYIGETDDLESRVARHREGRACRFTARRLPVDLVYTEDVADHLAGRRREQQLKRWTRAKKEALVAGDFEKLKRL